MVATPFLPTSTRLHMHFAWTDNVCTAHVNNTENKKRSTRLPRKKLMFTLYPLSKYLQNYPRSTIKKVPEKREILTHTFGLCPCVGPEIGHLVVVNTVECRAQVPSGAVRYCWAGRANRHSTLVLADLSSFRLILSSFYAVTTFTCSPPPPTPLRPWHTELTCCVTDQAKEHDVHRMEQGEMVRRDARQAATVESQENPLSCSGSMR